jgi:hypothetical protein
VDWQVLPVRESSPEARALLWITLVGAVDGIIHAQRGMTLAPDFTRTLHHAIRSQAMMPFDPQDCTTAISYLYLVHPTTTDRLALAAAQTIGNT